MTVRRHADWLSQTDERILELLAAEGSMHRTDVRDGLISYGVAFDVPDDVIDYRCSVLLTHGLLTRTTSGTVSVSATARAFLNGRLDLSEIENSPNTSGRRRFERDGAWQDPSRNQDPEEPARSAEKSESNSGFWLCPDCRWIGDRSRIDRDRFDEPICPICDKGTERVE